VSAYQRVLESLADRKKGYESIPTEALIDLAMFCRAHETAYHPDARLHAVIEGRREVWLRIEKFLTMEPEQLAAIFYGARKLKEIAHDIGDEQ
jgi:hypothetical protein